MYALTCNEYKKKDLWRKKEQELTLSWKRKVIIIQA